MKRLRIGGDIWSVDLGDGCLASLDFYAVAGATDGPEAVSVRLQASRQTREAWRDSAPLFSSANWSAYKHDATTVFAVDRPLTSHIDVNEGRSRILLTYYPSVAESDRPMFGHPFDQIVCMDRLAASKRGMVLHAACGAVRRGALLLVGASGAGKSTLSALLTRQPMFTVLTDERSIVWTQDDVLRASGSPWSGTAGIAEPGEVPLAGVFFLRHADRNYIEPIPPTEAATELFRCSFPTFWYRPGMEFALEFCIRVAKEVPCRVFGFRPDESAVDYLRRELA